MPTLEELEAELAKREASKAASVQVAAPETLETLEAEQARRQTTLSDIGEGARALGMESMTGFNRAVAGLLDFFTFDQINNVRAIMGDEAIPTLQQALIPSRGEFAQGTIAEGLPADIAGSAGELAVAGLTGQGLIQQGAKQLAPMAASTGARVLSQAAKPTIASGGVFGAASGAGEEVGREIGGETGALVGSVVAPIAGVATIAGGKAAVNKLIEKLGRNAALVDAKTGLPAPALEKALAKYGLEFGNIIDDVERLPVIGGRRSADQVVEKMVRRKLLDGSSDNGLAVLKLKGNEIVFDELGEEAIKQGFRAGDVSATKGMAGATKQEALKMLKMNRQILADSSKAQDFRPTDIVGKSVLKRFDYIRGKADSLRLTLDKIANKNAAPEGSLGGPNVIQGLKGQKVNTALVEDSVLEGLAKLRVDLPEEVLADTRKLGAFLKGKDAFVGSNISENPNAKSIVKKSIKLLSEQGSADAESAHWLKRQLDELIDFNKTSKGGLTESGRAFAKSVRHSLNESIREVSPQYAKVNDELSLSIRTMDEFQRTLGPSIDIMKAGASKAVGQDLRGLLSNRKSRVKLENAINGLDDAAESLGGQFNTNTKQLVQFANTLDNRFGAVADTSLKGELTSGIQQAARGKAGAIDLAVQKTAEGAEKLRGINDTNAMNVLHKILKR